MRAIALKWGYKQFAKRLFGIGVTGGYIHCGYIGPRVLG